MKKASFCYAVFAASAMLSLGTAFTASAAQWVADGEEWLYMDNSGEYAKEAWRSDNGISYYLGSDGYMVRDTLLNDNENYYYLRSSGQMARNEWRYIQNPEWQADDLVDEGSWYYFGDNGRAYRTTGDKVKIADIAGKKYAFDIYGRLMSGWISETGEYLEEENWQEGLYYADPEGEGELTANGWAYVTVTDPDNEEDGNPSYYFYFASNGKKSVDAEKKLGDKTYLFDSRGVSQHGWYKDDNENWRYFGDSEEPYLRTGWFEAVPHEQMNYSAHNDGTVCTYYGGGSGKITEGELKTIDGKIYAFNGAGERITGLVVLTFDENNSKKIASVGSVNYLADLPSDPEDARRVFYFNSDGSLKTGNVTVSIDSTDYSFSFKSTGSPKGSGTTGIDDNKIYVHGRCLTAEDGTRYQIVSWKNADYLVNESGVIQKNKKNIKDQDGYYYCTNKDGIVLHGPLSEKCTDKH